MGQLCLHYKIWLQIICKSVICQKGFCPAACILTISSSFNQGAIDASKERRSLMRLYQFVVRDSAIRQTRQPDTFGGKKAVPAHLPSNSYLPSASPNVQVRHLSRGERDIRCMATGTYPDDAPFSTRSCTFFARIWSGMDFALLKLIPRFCKRHKRW